MLLNLNPLPIQEKIKINIEAYGFATP